jgi:hypothetical protein
MRTERAWWALAAVLAAVVALWFVRTPLVSTDDVPASDAPALSNAAPDSVAVDAMALGVAAASPGWAEHGADEIELCGGLWVKTKPDGNIDDDDFKRVARLPEARARMLDALRADPGEFARAAAIRLALIGSEPPPLPEGVTTCEPAQCEADRKYAAQSAEARDALVQMATTTRDPQVYALAFNVCGATPNEASCRLLSAEQWARLEPGNAAPWLFVLARAEQRRDVAAQNEALHRIATSTRSDQHFFAMFDQVLAHTPVDEASTPATLTLAIEVMGVAAAGSLQGYQALNQVCKGAALNDSNRRQTCGAAAELLVTRSDTLLERSIGVRLGEKLGWPADRVDRLRGEFTAYVESTSEASMVWPPGACLGYARVLEGLKRSARLGEAGALREWVAQSEKKPEEFIRTEREEKARRAAQAASAAAASAPR